MPASIDVDPPREQYEQIRERILAKIQAGWESDLLMQQGMRSWIETGGQMPAKQLSPAERQPTDANWKPMIPIVASLLVERAERITK